MRLIPESANRQDWPRLVAQAVRELSSGLSSQQGASGWEVYSHGGGGQALVAAARTQLTIDGATKDVSQKPADVAALWDTATNTITGRNGDAIVVKVQFVFTPDDATASEVVLEVDIGGIPGVVEEQSFPVTNGASNPHFFNWTFAAYTLETWESNGGAIYATADGPGDITGLRIVIQRTHKAR